MKRVLHCRRKLNQSQSACTTFTASVLLLVMLKHARALSPQSTRLYSRTTPPALHVDLAHRLDGLNQPTVWHEFSPLAVQHDAINLGQGFPDWEPPEFCITAMEEAIRSGHNQYARSYAHLPLAKVLADIYSRRWNRTVDAASQVATAVGCTNALYPLRPTGTTQSRGRGFVPGTLV